MNVAVIGGGGREHTLAWKLAQSPSVDKLYALPGSDAMASIAECVPIGVEELDRIADFAVEKGIDMIVVGPEVPLTEGIADVCQKKGIAVFGPNKAAAQMEGSKVFAKNLMKKYHVPTAAYASFTDGNAAKDYIHKMGAPIVVKADGLAAGKGVVVAQTVEEAVDAVNAMMEDHIFGASGGRIVIEECMVGEEASLLAFVDGKTIVPMISAQDHKRIFDNDEGPNTGGMGAYAPAPVMTPELVQTVYDTILVPVVQGLANEGITYQGCLYAGLMITAGGPKVVEFNCRFGDPETQAVLPLLDGDLAQIMYACTQGTLRRDMVHWKQGAACCVIMASKGYPASSHKGDVISGLDAVDDDIVVFHSGTKKADGLYQTNGGRVLGVTAVGDSLQEAIDKAYANVRRISFDGQQVRSDIGAKGLRHLKK
ncbi:phosphoribosylamine--glycine ligase [Megasphaera hexanoica]|uniref:Phosphoribosylamine--glycine ligase n=1 Tax=Megasphaera hexanoica TaxID=1675036 RepID=A0A848BVC5_9FIRM|nr:MULTISPECIES: phosphoribosylamine--glycine ligase [Megasphaera]AXB82045.1 phosphoribosylamine--glycine ligase [Megasphaera hexanoica]KUH57360.1 phosphoribosylamine--glycine ligase [Megasphaera sp. DJF_B143]MCI5532335.1 phosphoribosylamine--glycine ligase [Caecibacter massiliensis]NME28194.1 phosphoribosylamine--glycine ligase [Megasphaera hexanoica]